MAWRGRQRWTGWPIVAALSAGLALRLYFLFTQSHIDGDSLIYGDIALNMLKHHVYGMSDGAKILPTLIRLPGYPLFLAACFELFGAEHYMAAMYVQAFLDLAACWFIAALAERLMGRRVGLWALWLGALCPFTANYVAAPLTETCSIFFTALAFYALERWRSGLSGRASSSRWTAVLTFALSFSVLLRPDRALLTITIVPAMAWLTWRAPPILRHRGRLQVVIVCAGVLLPLVLWGVRNWRVFHVVQPLAPRSATDPGEFVSNGFYRWYRTWGIDFKSTYDIYWNYDGAQIAINDVPARAFDSDAQRKQTADLFDAYNKIGRAKPVFDNAFAALAAQRIAADPVRYDVELPVMRLANMWLRPRTEMLPLPLDWWRFREHPGPSLVAASLGALNLAYLALAAIGLWRWRQQGWIGRRTLGYALAVFVLLRCMLLLTMDNSEPRYTIDCYPVVILLAAFGVTRMRRKERRAYTAIPRIVD